MEADLQKSFAAFFPELQSKEQASKTTGGSGEVNVLQFIKLGIRLEGQRRFDTVAARERLTELTAMLDRYIGVARAPAVEGGSRIANPDRARDIAQRALRAASAANGDRARVWSELGIPAIKGLLEAGNWSDARSILRQLETSIGSAETALSASDPSPSAGEAFGELSYVYGEFGRLRSALIAATRSVNIGAA